MNLETKKQVVESLKVSLSESNILLVAHYAGLTVDQMTALRSSAKENNVNVKVAKNSLIKLAIKDTEFSALEGELSGPTVLIFADDIVAAAKILVSFSKKNESLLVKTGLYNESIIGKEEIINISKMPSLDEIRAKLIGLIKAPATKIACVLQAPASQCARVVKAYSEK